MKAQKGTSAAVDFEENTWTFEMEKPYQVMAGEFTIIDSDTVSDIYSRVSRTIDAIGNNAELQHVKDDMRFILDKLD